MTHSNSKKFRFSETEKNIKYCPQHFPTGTVFQINETSRHTDYETGVKGPDTFTVQGVVCNGFDSYVLKTGVFTTIGPHDHETAFNLGHVVKIIKRGEGKVELDYGYHGAVATKRTIEDVERMKMNRPWAGWTPRKANHNTGSVQSLIFLEVAKMGRPDLNVDWTRLIHGVMSQPWALQPKTEASWHFVTCINKKRLRKFLRANLNRFLEPIKKSVKEYEAAMEEEYERDLDFDFAEDRNLSLPSTFLTNFPDHQLPMFQRAVMQWKDSEDFEVRDVDCDGHKGSGSLWYFGDRKDLTEFWGAFDKIRAEEMAKEGSHYSPLDEPRLEQDDFGAVTEYLEQDANHGD